VVEPAFGAWAAVAAGGVQALSAIGVFLRSGVWDVLWGIAAWFPGDVGGLVVRGGALL